MDTQTLAMCASMVHVNIGGLDDLPRSVASAIVHIYYEAASLAKFPLMPGDTGGLIKEIDTFAEVITATRSIPGFVDDLRKMRDETQGGPLFEYAVQLFLDIYKYRIPRAHEKSGLRRAIERRFSHRSLPEIPGLLEVIQESLRTASSSE